MRTGDKLIVRTWIKRKIQMSKTPIPNVPQPKRDASGKVRKLRKSVSHGTFRCKRKPNSPRCKNA